MTIDQSCDRVLHRRFARVRKCRRRQRVGDPARHSGVCSIPGEDRQVYPCAPLPVIVYVAPSAPARIRGRVHTEAANVAAMRRQTMARRIRWSRARGYQGRDGSEDRELHATFARTIAQQRGRNEDWVSSRPPRIGSASGGLAKNVVDIVAPTSQPDASHRRKVQIAAKL